MNILFVLKRYPFPCYDGGDVRNFNLLRQIARFHRLLVVTHARPEAMMPMPFPAEIRFVNPRSSLFRAALPVVNLFSARPYHAQLYHSRSLQQAATRAVEERDIDVVMLDSSYLAALSRPLSGVRCPASGGRRRPSVVVVEQNYEPQVMARYAENARSLPRRCYLALQQRKMLRFQAAALAQGDLSFACVSSSDRARMLNGDTTTKTEVRGQRSEPDILTSAISTLTSAFPPWGPDSCGGEILHVPVCVQAHAASARVFILPNGVDTAGFRYSPPGRFDTISFLGSLDWLPNADGLAYFFRAIWPRLKDCRPELKIVVVGKDSHGFAQRHARDGAVFTGFVPDVVPAVSGSAVTVVPLRMGGGSRLKILEAMALGRPVVSTSVGAEGIEGLDDGRNIVLADALCPTAFAQRVSELLSDSVRATEIGRAGRELVTRYYDWDSIGGRLNRVLCTLREVASDMEVASDKVASATGHSSLTTGHLPLAPDSFVSVIIPCRNEAQHIGRCLRSVSELEPVSGGHEVIVVDGMSADGTRKILAQWQLIFRSGDTIPHRVPICHLRILDNPALTAPSAMNIGIRAARGELIVRLDAHSEYPPDYLRQCVATSRRTGADNVGGALDPVLPDPSHTSHPSYLSARLVRALTTHRFGVGDSAFRTGNRPQRPQRKSEVRSQRSEVRTGYSDFSNQCSDFRPGDGPAETVPFGCFRREVFDWIGGYDERLTRNQDFELNRRLLRAGGLIWHNPRIRVRYFNQTTLAGLLRQAFVTGQWNPWTWYVASYAFALRHAVPSVFLLGLMLGVVLWEMGTRFRIVSPIWGIGLLATIAVPYSGLALAAAVMQASRYGWWMTPVLPLLFLAYHLTYGAGTLWGTILLACGRAPVQGNKIWKGIREKG
jgi:glycosyltransferase involved in cell wall biosynthesis